MNENKTKKGVSRKLRYGTVTTILTIFVVVAIFLCNIVMDMVEQSYPLIVDLTSDGAFSLSEESVTLAKGVDKPVHVTVFTAESYFATPGFTAQNSYSPEEMNKIWTQFYEALRQYELESGGKVTHEYIDLDARPSVQAAYSKEGITVKEGDILFTCDNRHQQATVQDLFSYQGQSMYAYQVHSEVENVLASKINLVSATSAKKVTLLVGHNEKDTTLEYVSDLLADNGCEILKHDITASSEPDDETDMFVIAAPASDYSVDEIMRLRQWIDNEGKLEKDLLVFINYEVLIPNLGEFLNDEYGIEVTDQLIAETDAGNYASNMPLYTYADVQSTKYTSALTSERALLPFCRALRLNITADEEMGTFAKPLATFGETAQVQGASGDGQWVTADSYPIVGAAYTTSRLYDNNDDRYYTTDVMVFGSCDFASETFMSVTSACNEELFLSTVRGLTGLESVISISGRNMTEQKLDFGGSATPKVLGIWVFTIGLPAILVVTAIVVFVKRRRL